MTKMFGSILGLALVVGAGLQAATLEKGQVVFQTDFEGAADAWAPAPQFGPGHQSARALAVAQPGGAVSYRLSLPVERMRGAVVRCAAMVKAEGVSAKPESWNGIKCMLTVESPEGNQWPQAPLETGTFDWRRAVFQTRIPTNATRVSLILGLEKVTGRVWFDDLKLTVVKVPPAALPGPIPGPLYKGHDLPRLRGVMISPNINEDGLRTLGRDWKANLIRWQLIRTAKAGQNPTLEEYDAWLEGELKKLDAALPLCEKYGLRVVLDLHSPPGGKGLSGGYIGSGDGLFTNPQAQAKFVEIWQRMARRYRDARPIWGYDLVNEPVEDFVEDGCLDWPELAERTARAIRAIDPVRALIIEPGPWGGPDGLRDFVPLPVSNVVYSVHMYLPHAFTHQGVNSAGAPLTYPGTIQGKYWDKAQLEAALKPAMDFQRRYHAHIYIGEFSAIRWAPEDSARRYLSDVIDIFEKQGWDWSYHAFREWQGWSVEHDEDRTHTARAAQPTGREQLLRQWMGQNRQ
jgi:hypothetical protein